ncbi:hypothetical protein WICMUC_005580 [Wickerhamomyces mucosus]|uniref:FAD-binding FR-type domain-containing protein n=1 Tax=Wickerhamomyces mucosus TaxID=1378264 RepID=A0A9P8P7N7_9ASCO|nr:hypothetical protein WICMUC_005580 [Wickerhamomyces mucosus]
MNEAPKTMIKANLRHSFRNFSNFNRLNQNKSLVIPEVKPKATANTFPEIKEIRLTDGLNEQYSPKHKPDRISYEFPQEPKHKPNLRWRKYFPIFALVGGASWAAYTINYFIDDIPSEYLSLDKFIPFVITNKLDVDQDHYLIELTPKYNKWKKSDNQIWNGNKLWSVEIKQPQIMVVRKYTPLPLEIHKDQNEIFIRVQNEDNYREGKLVLYIKKYQQGEVARWISRKPIGEDLELRGPFIEYQIPQTVNNKDYERPIFENLPSEVRPDDLNKLKITPDNLAFFAAGTGITPILQSLLSKNPYFGFTTIYYSRRTTSESKPFDRLLYFLEKLDRIKLVNFIGDDKLSIEAIPDFNPIDYKVKTEKLYDQKPDDSIKYPVFKTALEQAVAFREKAKDSPSLSIVCGPDAYISQIAGYKPYNGQGKLSGWLKANEWDENHVHKL